MISTGEIRSRISVILSYEGLRLGLSAEEMWRELEFAQETVRSEEATVVFKPEKDSKDVRPSETADVSDVHPEKHGRLSSALDSLIRKLHRQVEASSSSQYV